MQVTKEITSPQNELIRQILQLREKSRLRRKMELCVTEGRREVERALEGGFTLDRLVVCPALWGSENYALPEPATGEIIAVPTELYARIATRGSTEGVLALVRTPSRSLEDFELPGENPLVLVVEAVEKPGNLGALLRTADAAGLSGVLIADPQTDLYSPPCIRTSLGAVFTQNIGLGSSLEIRDWLKERSIRLFAAELKASVPYHTLDFRGPTALVLGAEDRGLSDIWLNHCDANMIIPMAGRVDSLNLSVSAAVLIFEAIRQRGL